MEKEFKENLEFNNQENDKNLKYSIFFILILLVAIFVGINNYFFKDKDNENTKVELAIGDKYSIPNYNSNYVWNIDDTNIATIDEFGNINAINSGTVKITALNNNEVIYEYTITITDKEEDNEKDNKEETPKKEYISFKEKNIQLVVNDTYNLELNEEYKLSNLTWTSSNENVVKVEKGKITALKEGNSIVTVTNKNGLSDTCNITVIAKFNLEEISFSIKNKSIYISEKYQTELIFKPHKVSTSIKYKSSNEKIATVSNNGLITGKNEGEATITATVNNLSTKINIKVIKNNIQTITTNFNNNGATSISSSKETCTVKNNGCTITLPTISREGYQIVGWSKNSNSQTAEYKPGEKITVYNNSTYYAITYKTLTATFDSNKANISKYQESCKVYNNNNNCQITTPTISRSNYQIIGWGNSSDANATITSSGGIITISNPQTYYAITKINKDGIEEGCTGWMAASSYYYSSPSTSSTKKSISVGTAFTIEDISGSYFKVRIPNVSESKYIQHKYVMINLTDYIPSMRFEITNASSSIYETSGYSIPNVTGTKLYSTGKVYNVRLRKNEYIVPSLYSTAKKLLVAQKTLLAKGYSIKVYDAYRPHSVSTKIYDSLIKLYNNNSTVKKNIDYSYGASGKRYSWSPTWFLSSSVSSHNTGSAVDITLVNTSNNIEVTMPTVMHELSTKAIKYYSSSVSKTPANYSKEMNEVAKILDKACTSAGLTTLASEWWHFYDKDANTLIKKTEKNGCDFQVSKIYSY